MNGLSRENCGIIASNVFPSVVFSPLLLKISYENSIEDVGFFVH